MSWGKEHLYTFCRVHVVVPNMGNTELYLSSCGCTKFGRHSRHTRQIAIPVTVYSCLATRAGVFRSSSATRSATEGKGGILSERFFPAAVHALGKRNAYTFCRVHVVVPNMGTTADSYPFICHLGRCLQKQLPSRLHKRRRTRHSLEKSNICIYLELYL